MRIKPWILPLAIVLLLAVGGIFTYIGINVFADNSAAPSSQEEATSDQPSESTEIQGEDLESVIVDYTLEESREKIEYAMSVIIDGYVDDVDINKLTEGAINGMLETLEDPYSVYMTAEQFEEFTDQLGSSFVGIGAEVSMMDGRVTIVAPFRDSPAEKAGLRPNDQIIEIVGEDIDGLTLNEAVMKIRGEIGTVVELTIQRPGIDEQMIVPVTRDEIQVDAVYSEIIEENDKKIGYIDITSFSDSADEEFETALQELEAEGIDGLIIDVRGNPGGLLDVAENIAYQVIPEGEAVVQTEDREGERVRYLSNLKETKDYPIVGLINEGSASASEILAAALIEGGGYEVLGHTTFGKGTVQRTINLEDGSSIKLTTFRWLTSAGNDINGVGVDPTIEVDQPDFFYAQPVDASEDLVYDMNNIHIENFQIMLNGVTEFDTGREDGYFDEQTEEAVRAFQENEELEVTGQINEETASRLQELVIQAVTGEEFDRQRERAVELLTEEE